MPYSLYLDPNEARQVLTYVEVYLDERPAHDNGFCYWAAPLCGRRYNGFYISYAVVGEVRRLWSNDASLPDHVDPTPGPTQKRLLFVRQLRDYLRGYLGLTPGRLIYDLSPALGGCVIPTNPTAPAALAVLRELQRGGEQRLDQIAAATGLRGTTVSARIRELRSKHLYNIETTRRPAGNGRQHWTYRLSNVA